MVRSSANATSLERKSSRQHGVVVQDEEAVEALVEAVADADVVAAGGAQVLGRVQQDRVRQEPLQFGVGAVRRGVVDDDDASVGVVDARQRLGEAPMNAAPL